MVEPDFVGEVARECSVFARVLHLSAGLMWGLMTTKRACKEDAFITKAHGVLVCVCVCVIVCVRARV